MSFPEPFFNWRPHPWHGLDAGPDPPAVVYAYIEITPFDMVKYELDKLTGYIQVDIFVSARGGKRKCLIFCFGCIWSMRYC